MIISVITACAQHDTIPNGGMEQWTANSSWSDPTNWMSDNTYTDVPVIGSVVVFKTTAAAHVHGGAAAAKLQTASVFGNIAPGTITTGYINSSTQNINDGCAINYRPLKFKGWYQYAPASATDTFVASIALYAGNTFTTQPIGTANFLTTANVTAWTEFDLPITYTSNAVPDTMLIIISSGTGNNSSSGTIAYVDDLSLVDCSLLSVSATPTAASCTQNNGSLVAAAGGTTGPYTYVWSNTSTTATISNIGPATYNVVATDAEGCSASASAAVTTSNVPFTVGLTPTAATCALSNGSVAASASAGNSPYTYLWSNTTTASSVSGLAPATYTVTVTDAHGCTTTATSSVTTTNAPFTVTPTNGTTSCASNTGVVSVSASAGNSPYTYLWANTSTAAQITGLGAGNYDVTVTDAHGCTTTAVASVTTPNGPSATDSVTNLKCHGDNSGKVIVTVTGGAAPLHYAWSNSATSVNLNGVAGGSYTLTITDNNSCSFAVSATIGEPAALGLTTNTTSPLCFGLSTGGASVTATGGTSPYTYAWTGGATSSGLSNVGAGPYSVTVTDNNLCSATSSTNINQPGALLMTGTIVNVSCNGGSNGSLTVAPTGGTSPYTYVWSNSSTGTSITGLTAGAYTAVVIDSHQCTDTLSQTVSQPGVLVVTTVPTNATSISANDGSNIAMGSGGTTPFNFLWSNGATGSNITSLAPGQYCVTVTDANNCTASRCDTVSYSVGVNSIASTTIKLYPNPVNNQLTIETNLANGKFVLSIYSLDGKLVEQTTVAGEKSIIMLNQLADGLYTYQLKEEVSGNINLGKLHIQR